MPLIVLIPGGAHFARIFYGGHEGSRPEDFLAHWLVQQGFPVLAISYPLESNNESAIMPPVAPGFRIHQWGEQAATVAAMAISEFPFECKDILLVGWSMGGRIIVPFTKKAKSLGPDVKLFVSLAATPGMAGARPPPPGVSASENGYATFKGMPDLFLRQIRAQEALTNNIVTIPDEVYLRSFYGNTPVGLLGWELRYDHKIRSAVNDKWMCTIDAAVDYSENVPWIACMYPTDIMDARHALTDRVTWEYMLTQKLMADVETRGVRNVKQEAWNTMVKFVDKQAMQSRAMEGNHYFFLGEQGAKKTAELLKEFWISAIGLQRQWESFFDNH